MERKIGEIFEYNGEWYQCLPEILICIGCAFKKKTCKKIRGIRGECERASRQTDGVIFKKLKKVGEPFTDNGKLYQRYEVFDTDRANARSNVRMYVPVGNEKFVCIEIKQNKEDMEERKLNLKPFDLQQAKDGKPVCTRDGRKARIICFNAKGDKPIIALIEMGVAETPNNYPIDGKAVSTKESPCDLMMLPEKKEGWILLRKDGYTFDNEEVAKRNCTDEQFVAKVEWEE